MSLRVAACGLILLWSSGIAQVSEMGDNKSISLKYFVMRACEQDSVFREILIDELKLKYAETLALPADDLVASITGDLGVTLSGDPDLSWQASLAKLFPEKGSVADAQLRTNHRLGNTNTDLQVRYGVEIAQNAFGRSTKLLRLITGRETRVARLQITEAYEDYLAGLVTEYFRWVMAFENARSAESSVGEAERLMDVIEKKRLSHIAYQVEVDKAMLQLTARQQRLLSAQREFSEISSQIKSVLGVADSVYPDTAGYELNVDNILPTPSVLTSQSRNDSLWNLLVGIDSLQIELAAEQLLPSARVYGGLGWSDAGDDLLENTRAFVGIDFDYSFQKSKEKARLEVQKLEREKRGLENINFRRRLASELEALSKRLRYQKEELQLSLKRLELAKNIYEAERNDYRYGKTDINDLIQALNSLQDIRLTSINQSIELKITWVEWLRLTDRLVMRVDQDAEGEIVPIEPVFLD